MIKKQNGQSLWEVLIALMLASLVALGLVRVSTTSVKSSSFSSEQSRMTAYAQQRMSEIVDFKNKNQDLFWDGTQYFPSPGPVGENIWRELNDTEHYCTISTVSDANSLIPTEAPDYVNAKMKVINVKIFWEEGSGTDCDGKEYVHNLSFDTYVTN